ncbi:MAG TPA: MFS transporter [Thermoanaerobacterales bacterium]|nr:MFS transporter [Thermoanaerobacterales bacterium]
MKFDIKIKNFALVLAATIAFISTYYLMMPVIPSYMLQKGFDNMTIGLVVFFFSASSLIARPLGGVWVEKMGSRKLMLLSIVLFFITPALVKLPLGVAGLGMAQLIYGLTVGTFTVASATFTTDISTSETIAQFMGLNSISFTIAKGMAPALGIKLMDAAGFNGAVIATVIAGLIALILVFLLADVKTGRKTAKNSSFTETLLNKYVFLPTIVLFCGMTTFGAISAMLPVFAHERGITGIEYFFLINTSIVVVSRLIIGPWSRRYLETLVALSMILMTLTFLAMSMIRNFYQLVAVALVYGVGFAILFPILTSVLVLHIPGIPRGMALGIFSAGFDMGVAAGALLGGFSQFISFKVLYLVLSLVPLAGYLIFQYVYRPAIRTIAARMEMNTAS